MAPFRLLITGVPFGLDDAFFEQIKRRHIPYEYAEAAGFTIESLFTVPVDMLVIGSEDFVKHADRIEKYKLQVPRTTILVFLESPKDLQGFQSPLVDGVLFADQMFAQLEFHLKLHHFRHRLSEIIENQQRTLDHQRHFLDETNAKLESWVVNLEKDFSVINTVQERLIPKRFPQSKSLLFQGFFAAGSQSGGDFFDIFPLHDRPEIGLIHVDSVGHSVTSSLLTALMKIAVLSPESSLEVLDRVVDSLRNHLVPVLKKASKAVNMRVGILDQRKLTFEFADFGFRPFFHFHHSTGDVETVYGPTNAVFAADQVFEAFVRHSIQLKPGDLLFLPSDGCVPFLDSMIERFKSTQTRPLLEMRNELAHILKKESKELSDDASFILVKVDEHALQLVH